MLFMVIEHFRDARAVHQRLVKHGRMLPDGVTYCASWVEPVRRRCFQLMDAEDVNALQPWIARWADLVDFDVVPVVESSTYWAALAPEDGQVDLS